MQHDQQHDRAWNIFLTNYDEGEYHRLSKEELLGILQDEWEKDFNGIFIGRDVDCVGRLGIFFKGVEAFVGYEDFENNLFWASYDAKAREAADWDQMVRLSPDDSQEWSFQRCSIIPKRAAWDILEHHLATLEVLGLYLLDSDVKPCDQGLIERERLPRNQGDTKRS